VGDAVSEVQADSIDTEYDNECPDDASQVRPLLDRYYEPRNLNFPSSTRTPEEERVASKALRNEYGTFLEEKSSKYVTVLKTISEKNERNHSRKNDNLMKLLGDVYFLTNCYEKIKSNQGALTPGTDSQTVDEMTMQNFVKASEELRSGTYRFHRSRRIYVDKPGKSTKRPITIPNSMDKIVQEGIRVILNAIYEPVFRFKSFNYGFRPGVSCNEAIQKVKDLAKGSDFALEGDIEGAYNNVQHEKMVETLRERISDNKFLKLIRQLHKSGIMEDDITKDTTLGIPQGGIASPILFNIYMHNFDMFVERRLKELVQARNSQRERVTSNPFSRRYRQIDRKLAQTRNRIDTIYRQSQLSKVSEVKKSDFASRYKEIKKAVRKNKTTKTKIRSSPGHLKQIRALYIRYADDWIIFTNMDEETVMDIKKEIAEYLKSELGLTLSEDKTVLTNLHKKYAKFLGFRFKNNQGFAPIIRYQRKMKDRRTGTMKLSTIRQRASWGLFVDIDHERVENRMILRGMLTEKKRPRALFIITQLKEHEIVTKYRQMISGLFNYYVKQITFKSSLSRYYFYLLYSCYHTIVSRKKTSMRKVMTLYGPDLKMSYTTVFKNKQDQVQEKTSFVRIPKYGELMRLAISRTVKFDLNPPDFFSLRVNLLTAFKYTRYCGICGAHHSPSNPIQAHHVRQIKKGINTRFVNEVMRVLNKKQLVCCKVCHNRIHNGTYNGLNLSSFFDPVLAKL
jgi:group II intron reverse transcriptase/maturase